MRPNPTARRRLPAALAVLVAVLLLTTAACGSSSDSKSSGGSDSASAPATGKLTIGYSAWPGWFPLAVAEKEGIFKEVGLDVDLKYFPDYTASLDALVAGKVDVNSQTLNDTMFGVAAGSDQKIVITGDNSTGNDQVICDESIKTVDDLKGKTVAAEAGVVDHFLLLQGLKKNGMTEDDIDFKGVKTDAAAAGFEGGEFDCVAVFAPFTVQALKRPGSHTLFSSKDFPGVIPDHFVATGDAAARTEDMDKLVKAWYLTLDWIKAHPEEATKIMAEKAGLTTAEYDDLASGTTLFTPEEALNAFADREGDPTSLPEMARQINPFLVSSGLTKEEAPLDGLFEPKFTQDYVDSLGATDTGATTTAPASS